jgi:hypothetical protein
MGGQAFAHIKGVVCPRMSPEHYHWIRSHLSNTLEKLFIFVTVPREAPGKKDYGDIDFLVSHQVLLTNPSDVLPEELIRLPDMWTHIEHLFKAKHHISHSLTHSYAVPHWFVDGAFVQVDIELSPGQNTPECKQLFEWTKFMKSDADLLQIIGICHKPLGLTCNDKGLHVRLEQIEPYNKKKALLFLTLDPEEAMSFYRFDTTKYKAGFHTEEELFDWVINGRFFSRDVFEGRIEKANDRARQNKRPMYKRFVEEYMASHLDIGKSTWTRAEVLEQALETFNVRATYQAMIEEHNTKEAEEVLWKEIREALPLELQNAALGLVLKGLRRWVVFEDGEINSSPTVQSFPAIFSSTTLCSSLPFASRQNSIPFAKRLGC